MNDTIFALSTPTGKAGVAIIRISGEKAVQLFGGIIPKEKPQARFAIHTPFVDPQTSETIDIGLCLFFPAPHSFTGEDVLELHLHGSLAVLKKIFEILGKIPNFRPADPGEFSRRAFLHNKFDLTQAESLIDLIDAETEHQRRAALENARGQLFQLYSGWHEKMQELCAYCEACLDFSDEELPDDLESHVLDYAEGLHKSIKNHLKTAPQGQRLRLGVNMAIIGPSNAGKSSLLNYFTQTQSAITSPIAGTTRDVIERHIDIAGYAVNLIDTAGIQETDDPIEKLGIQRAKEIAQTADLILLMFDGSKDIIDVENYQNIQKNNDNIIILINKKDQFSQRFNTQRIEEIYPNIIIEYISITQELGMDSLQQTLKMALEKLAGNSHAPLITHARYQKALERCQHSLENIIHAMHVASQNLDEDKNIDLVAEELRVALYALGQILGHHDVENLLEIVFSRFCIGK